MNKPNFLCVGAQKAGTTSLYNILKQHSQIFMPEQKELHFFDWEKNFNKGTNWYFSHFENSEKFIAKGEITPNYMYFETVPEKILKILGKDIKLIFMLRNPAERAFSHYKMRIGRGFEKNSFEKAVNLELEELKKEYYSLEHKYIDRGFYDIQIKRYLELFDKKNMFFMLFEDDFLKNKENSIKDLLKFLQVDDNEELALNIKNTPGTASKSEKADKILNTANPINRFAKKIIPSKKARTNIKYFFTKINQKATADKSELEKIKPFLTNEVYKESILELQDVINRDLSSWLKL